MKANDAVSLNLSSRDFRVVAKTVFGFQKTSQIVVAGRNNTARSTAMNEHV